MFSKLRLDSAFETVAAAVFLAFRADENVCQRFGINQLSLPSGENFAQNSCSCRLHLSLQFSYFVQTRAIIFSLSACFATSEGDSQLKALELLIFQLNRSSQPGLLDHSRSMSPQAVELPEKNSVMFKRCKLFQAGEWSPKTKEVIPHNVPTFNFILQNKVWQTTDTSGGSLIKRHIYAKGHIIYDM